MKKIFFLLCFISTFSFAQTDLVQVNVTVTIDSVQLRNIVLDLINKNSDMLNYNVEELNQIIDKADKIEISKPATSYWVRVKIGSAISWKQYYPRDLIIDGQKIKVLTETP